MTYYTIKYLLYSPIHMTRHEIKTYIMMFPAYSKYPPSSLFLAQNWGDRISTPLGNATIPNAPLHKFKIKHTLYYPNLSSPTYNDWSII